MDPSAMLSRLAVAFESGKFPQDLREWLREGVRAYMAGHSRLDDALGLTARQGKSNEHPPRAIRLQKRDAVIQALAYWQGDDAGSQWDRAQSIAEWLESLEGGVAPHVHGPIAYLLTELVLLDYPRSARQIFRILQGDRSC